MNVSASSACSAAGNRACILRSVATSACTSSFWLVTDTYSPVPIENDPATSAATPVRTTVCAATPPPPSPAISEALVTSPSTAPNTVGRSQPPDTSRWRCDHPAASAAWRTAILCSSISSPTRRIIPQGPGPGRSRRACGQAGRRSPGLRVEGAVDGGPGHLGEAAVVVPGIGPQPGEGLGEAGAGAFGDYAFGLFDHYAAGQGVRELLVQALGLGAGTMLHDAESGQIGERAGDDEIRLAQRGHRDAEQVQGAQGRIAQPQRQRGRRGEPGLDGSGGERRPAARVGLQVLGPDPLAGPEGVQAGAFLGLQLEQLKQAHRLA